MTKQHKNPENPRKIEITEADLAPLEVDVRVADIADHTEPVEPIVLDESDFPKEITPERVVLGKADFGGDQGKPTSEELKTAKIFKDFIGKHLPKNVDEYSAADQMIREREASYSVRSEGQYIPITRVNFVEYSEDVHDLDGPPSNYSGVEIYGEDDERLRDLRYDELKGFVTVNTEGDYTEVAPSEAIELVTLLSAAGDRGDLTKIKP